ncbi:hypothetical protein D3C80_1984070 [compost metagenome]
MIRLATKAMPKLMASNWNGGMPSVRVVSRARQDQRKMAIIPMAVAEVAFLPGSITSSVAVIYVPS